MISILTGCHQPVQPNAGKAYLAYAALFQSSPAVTSRCNYANMTYGADPLLFQSSPAVTSRCNRGPP